MLRRSLLLVFIFIVLITAASAQSVYYPAHGNGAGTFNTYTGTICTNQGASSPCARYDEGSLRIDMDLDTVKYQVQNSQGTWRYIQYDIPNPTSLIPSPQNNPKSLVWMGMYANNTNLRYVMQSHGIKLDIWGSGTPPSNTFNFTYTLSTGVTHRMQGEEILFLDTVTGEPLWLVQYPTMHVNGTNIPLTFKRDGDKISIHAPDLFTSGYNFSAGWELDPSTQSGSTIYIDDRHNLTEVNADIANTSVLEDLGSGEWLLNANLVNNNTANSFYLNETDVTWLKINSTHTAQGNVTWYYLTNGQTEIDNMKITSWNTTSSTVEDLPATTWARSAIYASGASSKMNISNSNLSYLGYNTQYKQGVTYVTTSGNQIINNTFLKNYHGILLTTSSNNNLTDNTVTSALIGQGIFLYSTSNYNTLINNTGTSYTSSYGIYLYTSSSYNTLINNTGTSNTGSGIILNLLSNYNILTSNTGISTSNNGIYISSSNYNNLTSNIGTSTSSFGLNIYQSSENNFTSNTATSNSNVGLKFSDSSNNTFTSNTFNTNSTTSTIEDIMVISSSRNNTFIGTDFTTKSRKIEFYTTSTSEFNQSQDNGVSFLNTNLSIASTTNRSIINWSQNNITFTENFTVATQTNYSATGLLPNSDYRIWNDTVNDFSLTTDEVGVLPDFKINFTTTARTVSILQEDFTPPASITNLTRTTTTTSINWTWTNPTDTDFNYTSVYLDGAFKTNISTTSYTASSLSASTSYTISTRTVDTSGNMNTSWVNNTATTNDALSVSGGGGGSKSTGSSFVPYVPSTPEPTPVLSIVSPVVTETPYTEDIEKKPEVINKDNILKVLIFILVICSFGAISLMPLRDEDEDEENKKYHTKKNIDYKSSAPNRVRRIEEDPKAGRVKISNSPKPKKPKTQ